MVQLASIQERPVPAADIDDGAGETAEVEAVHHFSTAGDLLSPEDAAKRLGVPERDVLAIIGSGELVAKKIGASHRIKRSELEAYLSR
jgi:excisionase family DNA binding protein